MTMAETTNSTTAASADDLPLGGSLAATINRFREIAASSGNALLMEGEVHPDHRLLDVCGEALHLLAHTARVRREMRAMERTAEQVGEWRSLGTMASDLTKQAKPLLVQAGKLRATTPAGIYAKALLVRMSISGAPFLAASLAAELVECSGLRASLWPASMEGAA